MLVRKIKATWSPSENPGLQVGETINMDNYETLVAEGNVEVVTETKKTESKKEESK